MWITEQNANIIFIIFYSKKVNCPQSKITLSQLFNIRVDAHLHMLAMSRQWAANTAQLYREKARPLMLLPSQWLSQH